jgi:hypothetical protein
VDGMSTKVASVVDNFVETICAMPVSCDINRKQS